MCHVWATFVEFEPITLQKDVMDLPFRRAYDGHVRVIYDCLSVYDAAREKVEVPRSLCFVRRVLCGKSLQQEFLKVSEEIWHLGIFMDYSLLVQS